MAIVKKATNILQRFKRDESGMAALSWALSLTAIIGAMGAAMDFAMLSSADARSQTIADTTALSAAIYMKNFEQIPQNREKGLIGEYTAHELGYDYKNWVVDGAEGVSVNISYDNVAREATATVIGYTNPTLVQLLGFGKLRFSAQTVVKYYEKDVQDPASVVMILDNSGSMYFDDKPLDADGDRVDGTQRRIDGLKTGAINFMAMLSDTVGPQDGSQTGEPRVLRTGMMAFSNTTIASRTVPMDWDILTDGEINAMAPGGATNSAPPLVTANQWLNIGEPPVHALETPGKTLLKYIILMTDGKNTVGNDVWVAREGTENWRRWVTGRESADGLSDWESNTVEVTPESCENEIENYSLQCAYDNYSHIKWRWGPYQTDPGPRTGTAWGATYTCNNEANYELVCEAATYETRYSGFEYGQGESPPDSSGTWEEGEFDIESNIATRAECDLLHSSGVEVFTVAFALEPGAYRTNDWGQDNYGNPDKTITTSQEDANKARGILQYCATKEENFITANDTDGLQAAFDRIGNTIIKEIIRISS